MGLCKKIRYPHRQYCSGDLIHSIVIAGRDIQAPSFDSVDFDEAFTNPDPVPAAIKTIKGRTYFDGVNTETPITHEIAIRFDPGVTAENWILYNGQRIDILDAQNLDERSEWLVMQCTDRGLDTQEATKI